MVQYSIKPYGFGKKMPIKNIPLSQTQQKIFAYKLKDELNPKKQII